LWTLVTICSSGLPEYPKFFQVDGNVSLASDSSHDAADDKWSEEAYNIETIIGNRPPARYLPHNQRIPCRKTLRRDNRGELALNLPNLAV
jgi:hypothetical protein